MGRNSEVRIHVSNLTIVTVKMWAYSPQNAEIGNIWYKFAQKGYTPLSDFYKIWLGERVPGLHPHTKFHRSGLKIVGLQPKKIAIFSINLPKWGIPIKRFLQNVAWGESQVRTLIPNFTLLALKMWAYNLKNGDKLQFFL